MRRLHRRCAICTLTRSCEANSLLLQCSTSAPGFSRASLIPTNWKSAQQRLCLLLRAKRASGCWHRHDLQTWQNMTHKLRSTPVRELTSAICHMSLSHFPARNFPADLSGRDPFGDIELAVCSCELILILLLQCRFTKISR